jgi:indole-3-glycerol phosphate synthase
VEGATYLEEILAAHRNASDADDRRLDEVEAAASAAAPPRGFAEALRMGSKDRLAVIAEVKRRSPSKGVIDATLDPGAVARQYEDGGASCLSVLTDASFFGGSSQDLVAARAASRLPVLRKDFTVSSVDVLDARAMGADAVLLIVAALSDAELVELRSLAEDLRMAALVEVHDARELDRALAAGARMIGVNQRDLSTFEVVRTRAEELAALIPPGVVTVAESGIRDAVDARRVAAAGYDAALVGESLLKSPDRAAAVRQLTVRRAAGRSGGEPRVDTTSVEG